MYVRTIVNVFIGLYVTRIVLSALGNNDYGIYSLVAGVVSLLSFITSAMTSTTQRFISFHQTHSDRNILSHIFSNSLIIHIGLALCSLIILELLGIFLFNGALNILPERVSAAKFVYQCTIFMTICTFITAPYNALLIAHENLIFTSIISICDSILKLLIAFIIDSCVNVDQLKLYAFLMCSISVFNFLGYIIYSLRNYNECKKPRAKHFNISYIKQMGSFASWTLFGTACTLGRAQGVAIIINKIWSTVGNAAFGIASQINGAVLFVGNSLLTAIIPQIIKAEGRGERANMLKLATTASKVSFILLSTISIPLIIHIESVLKIWLGNVPLHAALLCRVILISNLADFLTYGLNTANQARGKLKSYSLIVYSLKITTIPVLILFIYAGVDLRFAFWSYAIMELCSSLARIPLLHSAGLKIWTFIHDVFILELFPLAIFILLNIAISNFVQSALAQCFFIVLSIIAYAILVYSIGLTFYEKNVINSIIKRVFTKND